MTTGRETWREFWNRENSIYVNERHRLLHDDLVARDIAGLIDGPDEVVLDFGCGDASSAGRVAEKCRQLCLFDAASSVRARLRERFADSANVTVLEDEGLSAIPDGSLDLIVVNSVLQYIPKRDFEALLDRFRAKLKASGRLALADVLRPGAGALADVRSLLSFAYDGGFLFAACLGLAATFFSDYRKLRVQYGLTRYDEAEMISILGAHGFAGGRAPRNIGHNQARTMFLARPGPIPERR